MILDVCERHARNERTQLAEALLGPSTDFYPVEDPVEVTTNQRGPAKAGPLNWVDGGVGGICLSQAPLVTTSVPATGHEPADYSMGM